MNVGVSWIWVHMNQPYMVCQHPPPVRAWSAHSVISLRSTRENMSHRCEEQKNASIKLSFPFIVLFFIFILFVIFFFFFCSLFKVHHVPNPWHARGRGKSPNVPSTVFEYLATVWLDIIVLYYLTRTRCFNRSYFGIQTGHEWVASMFCIT